MEPLVGAAIAELAGMYVGLLDRGLVFGQGQAAAYHDDGKSIGPRHSGRTWPSRMLEFCVHGIVVHLRLGNCIGYSLRELNAESIRCRVGLKLLTPRTVGWTHPYVGAVRHLTGLESRIVDWPFAFEAQSSEVQVSDATVGEATDVRMKAC